MKRIMFVVLVLAMLVPGAKADTFTMDSVCMLNGTVCVQENQRFTIQFVTNREGYFVDKKNGISVPILWHKIASQPRTKIEITFVRTGKRMQLMHIEEWDGFIVIARSGREVILMRYNIRR